jgi:hypothetical protein
MQKRVLFFVLGCFLSFNVLSQYIYEANQSLIDLTNQSGTTNLNSGDDQVSNAFNLGFTFDFYGEAFTQGRIATNGCLHFKTSGAYCSDFTPDPLVSQYTYTLLPFWTDLITDNGSSMLAKSFSDKTVFGWYDMREYNRASDNSFEVILWTNDTFEFRYGALDIIDHDVLIGEVGSGSKEIYQYYYHDECTTGSTNSSSCYNYDWNNSDKNTNLENGGSLYGVGTGNGTDCSDPLNDSSCTGYADAYQTQQCNITQLYNESCPYYWDAYDDQQCDQDPQYAPFCQGYSQQDSVAYFDEETDYGYQEEDMWYDEEYDEWLDPSDPCYENNCADFTDADWYALDVDQFGQEQVDDWLGNDVSFSDDGMIDFNTSNVTSYDDLDVQMDIFDLQHQDDMLIDQFTFQETYLVEDYSEPETFIEFNNVEELEEWFEEETRHQEEMHEEEFAELDEPEEEFIEEIFEEEAVEEVFEAIEERIAEAEIEEERLEREEIVEEFEEVFEEEFQTAEREEATGKSSISRDVALRVVASTLNTATQSVSGTKAGNSIHSTGNSVAAGNSSSGASSSNAGISTSSSPSMSDQFASASVQTNQVLDMSSMSVSSSTSSSSLDTTGVGSSVVVSSNTSTAQNQLDTSINAIDTSSDTETVVEDLIAQNLQTAQEEVEAEQEETGEYGSEDTIIAYMGFVPGFNTYEKILMVDQDQWYTSRTIYTETMPDNINAFYGLAGSNISKMNDIINSQPPL